MTFDVTGLNVMANAQRAVTLKMALHNGDPGAGAANELSGSGYARQSCTWNVASGGVATLAAPVVFNVPATTPTYITVWSSDNLTRYAKIAIASPHTYGAPGTLSVDSGSMTVA